MWYKLISYTTDRQAGFLSLGSARSNRRSCDTYTIRFFSYLKIVNVFIVFFPLLFTHLIPSSTSTHHSHHIVVRIHEFIHCFAWYLHPTPLLPQAVNLLSTTFCLWVCLYFSVSLVCSLDSTDEWNHMVFVFLWMAYIIILKQIRLAPV